MIREITVMTTVRAMMMMMMVLTMVNVAGLIQSHKQGRNHGCKVEGNQGLMMRGRLQ